MKLRHVLSFAAVCTLVAAFLAFAVTAPPAPAPSASGTTAGPSSLVPVSGSVSAAGTTAASGRAFEVWAPFADEVGVAGDFNGWTPAPLAKNGAHWSGFVAGAKVGDRYKFAVRRGGVTYWRNDPRAKEVTNSSGESVIFDPAFDWDVREPIAVSWTGKSLLAGTVAGVYTTNRLTGAFDAGGREQLRLECSLRNYGDETHAQDGVFVSSNGSAWTKIAAFPAKGAGWKKFELDLPASAAFVRFQQYDDYPFPSDGVAVKDAAITGVRPYQTPYWNEAVIYEMHVGTFHDLPGGGPGTFASAIAKLDYLKDLGVNAVKVMPIAEFPGDFSWGYNPSHPFAVESAYGGPKGFKEFVKQAHARGIAVILDVVYNHWGPSDLDLWRFDGWSENGKGGIYFYNDGRSKTPWGDTRPDYGRGEVRVYVRDNAMMWLDEYRVDGLRWDSTVNIRTWEGGEIAEGWSLMQWINASIDPWKISIAEDLQGNAWITKPVSQGGAGFGAQWDAGFVHPVRAALVAPADGSRNVNAVAGSILGGMQRVVYTESHDEVANGKSRLPEEIWPGNAGSWASKKRSTLGAVLVFTSPGIPMIFQGQEILEDGWFQDTDPVDWGKLATHSGIRDLYRDLIHLRRTLPALRTANVNVHHVNATDKVIAFHRWTSQGDDVIVLLNLSAKSFPGYTIGFPAGGSWRVRFNSDWKGYSGDFGNFPSFDTWASWGAKEGMSYSASVGVGPYSAVILTR